MKCKKIAAMLLTVVLAVSVLAGCGGAGGPIGSSGVKVLGKTQGSSSFMTKLKAEITAELDETYHYDAWGGFVSSGNLNTVLSAAIKEVAGTEYFHFTTEDATSVTCLMIGEAMMESMGLDPSKYEIVLAEAKPADEADDLFIASLAAENAKNIYMWDKDAEVNLAYKYDGVSVSVNGEEYYVIALAMVCTDA